MNNIVDEMLSIKNKKFFSMTTACLSLLDETNRINEILKNNENTLIDNPEFADFIVVTGCAVSKDSAINSVNNVIKLTDCVKDIPIFVGGCISNAKEKELLANYKNVKHFTADQVFEKVNTINSVCEKTTKRCDPFWLNDIDKKKAKLDGLVSKNYKLAKLFAYTNDGIVFSKMPFEFDTIRISKGCNKQCSYCAIPHNRGKYIEHEYEYVKNQIENSKNDHILLIGENIGKHEDFNKIIEYAISKDKKIMLRYLEPEHVNKLKEEYLPNIEYVGVPVQTASIRILKDMRRPQNINEVSDKFKLWSKKGIFIGTSIILCYPTETIFDYLKSLKFIISAPVDYVSFQNFSVRENTPIFEQYKNWNSNSLKNRMKFGLFNSIVALKSRINYVRVKYNM